jgi:hypothetical protein
MRHIAAVGRAQLDSIVGIRWCLACKGVPGDGRADEWAKPAAEPPDSHRVKWQRYADRFGGRPMPFSRCLAHLKREVSEKNLAEAGRWTGDLVTGRGCKLPSKRPDGTVGDSEGRLASGSYQLKTGPAHGPEEPGPGQVYAIQARKHIATLRKARPNIVIDIRW